MLRQTDGQRISPMHWDPIGSNNRLSQRLQIRFEVKYGPTTLYFLLL